jgi:transcriptional regulator with XRE-family HTH domain
MIGAMARHRVQVLRAAKQTLKQIVAATGVSQSSVQRIERERPIEQPADLQQACERGVGRPSVVEEYRERIAAVLKAEPKLPTVEILHRMRGQGYAGGKSALYELACELRPKLGTPLVRFEGVAGEFSQHDFGQVEVRYANGTHERIHFFVSRLKYSRWVDVRVVENGRRVAGAEPARGLRKPVGCRSWRCSATQTVVISRRRAASSGTTRSARPRSTTASRRSCARRRGVREGLGGARSGS